MDVGHYVIEISMERMEKPGWRSNLLGRLELDRDALATGKSLFTSNLARTRRYYLLFVTGFSRRLEFDFF